jgi:hypothetical protein
MDFTKKEAAIVASMILFSVLWVFLVIPVLTASTWFQALIPPFQYVLFYLGFAVLVTLLIGLPVAWVVAVSRRGKRKVDYGLALRVGLGSWLSFSLVLDMWLPPFYLSPSGTVLLNIPNALTGTAVDATFTWIFQQIGVSGPALYYCVYALTPAIAVFLTALILAGKDFLKLAKNL